MKKNNKGFSLVELIVVIAIMAILAAVAVTSFSIYIDRAQEQADEEYLINLLHYAELFAIERQLNLQWVEIAPEVQDKDDIKLIYKDSDDSLREYLEPDEQEIIEAVGQGFIEGGWNNGKYKPEQELPPPPDYEGDDPDCQHLNEVLLYEQAPTCTQSGWKQYRCPDCQRGRTEDTGDPIGHRFEVIESKGKYTYSACDNCGRIQIKSSDGSVIVPIN